MLIKILFDAFNAFGEWGLLSWCGRESSEDAECFDDGETIYWMMHNDSHSEWIIGVAPIERDPVSV